MDLCDIRKSTYVMPHLLSKSTVIICIDLVLLMG